MEVWTIVFIEINDDITSARMQSSRKILIALTLLCVTYISHAPSPPSRSTSSAAIIPDGTLSSATPLRIPSAATVRLQRAARKLTSQPYVLRIDILSRLATALSAEHFFTEAIDARYELLNVIRTNTGRGGSDPVSSGLLRNSVALAADLKAVRRFREALDVVHAAQKDFTAVGASADPAASIILLKVCRFLEG